MPLCHHCCEEGCQCAQCVECGKIFSPRRGCDAPGPTPQCDSCRGIVPHCHRCEDENDFETGPYFTCVECRNEYCDYPGCWGAQLSSYDIGFMTKFNDLSTDEITHTCKYGIRCRACTRRCPCVVNAIILVLFLNTPVPILFFLQNDEKLMFESYMPKVLSFFYIITLI